MVARCTAARRGGGLVLFRRTTLESTLAAILSGDAPQPKRAGSLAPLLVRLLEKEPEWRLGGDEVAAALEAVAEG